MDGVNAGRTDGHGEVGTDCRRGSVEEEGREVGREGKWGRGLGRKEGKEGGRETLFLT